MIRPYLWWLALLGILIIAFAAHAQDGLPIPGQLSPLDYIDKGALALFLGAMLWFQQRFLDQDKAARQELREAVSKSLERVTDSHEKLIAAVEALKDDVRETRRTG